MTERELWLKCVNHCIKNEIIGFHLMFDVFLEMREREGYKLVPVEPNDDAIGNGCKAISHGMTNEKNCIRIYKAMVGAVE